MKQLPSPEIYEQEMIYLPWGRTIEKVLEFCLKAPKNFRVLDLMCGTGYLLGKIAEHRKDLDLTGVDIDERFIEYARTQYSGINFIKSNVLDWEPDGVYDVILCTGALHHMSYAQQPLLIEKIEQWLNPDSRSAFVLAENFIRDYTNETERRKSAIEYGKHYLEAAVANNAPPEIIKAVLNFMQNDILGIEYKISFSKMVAILKDHFPQSQYAIAGNLIWGDKEREVGDYLVILAKKNGEVWTKALGALKYPDPS